MNSHQNSDQLYGQNHGFAANLFCAGFGARIALVLFFMITDVDRTYRLTKDGFFYDQIGKEIAEYYRTGGVTEWPRRVFSVVDFLYEHIVGIVYYLTDDSMLAMRCINAAAGAFVPVLVWKMASYITDNKTARRAAVWSALFPTQFYYSCLPVRDSLSTMAIVLVFLGMTAITSNGKGKDVLALPIGLALTAGFRAYIFTVLAALIPCCWLATSMLSRSKSKGRFIAKILLLSGVAIIIGLKFGLDGAFSSGKAAYVMDLDYWNKIREKMNHGAGAVYSNGDIPMLGESIRDTLHGIFTGLWFFFVSVDPTSISSFRQVMAIPESLAVVYMMPSMWRGLKRVLRYHRFSCLPLLLLAGAITFGYSSVTTNGGPLMRWRLQVVNIYILVAAIGYSRNYLFERNTKKESEVSQDADEGYAQLLTPSRYIRSCRS
jgi:4-amino-4-deoxy-L-arabinose transferase-like glycosyltransferase